MLHLKTSHKKALDLLVKQSEDYQKIQKDRNGEFNFYAVVAWVHTTKHILEMIYGDDNIHTLDYTRIMREIPTDEPHFFINQSINLSRAVLTGDINEIQISMDNPEFQEPST